MVRCLNSKAFGRCVLAFAAAAGLSLQFPVIAQSNEMAAGKQADTQAGIPSDSSAAPFDFWRLMPPAPPPAVLPGDPQPWNDACADSASVPRPLTLVQAVAIALCSNPQARQAWVGVIASTAQVGQAKAAFLPTVTGSVSRTLDSVSSSGAAGPNASRFFIDGRSVSASWLLFDFGGRAANVTQAERNVAAAMASRDALLQQLVAAIGQAYAEATAHAASVTAAMQAETSARESLAAARGRMGLGVATIVDALQAQTALSQATLLRVRAQGNARTALGTLAYTMGVDLRTRLELPVDPDLYTPSPDAPADNTAAPAEPPDAAIRQATDALRDIDSLIEQAITNHPSLSAARAQLAAAQARADGAAADGYPTVSLSGGQYRNGRPGTAFTSSQTTEKLLAITLNVPLFEGFARSYKVREQQALVEAKSLELAGAQLQVELDVWRNYHALQTEAAGVDTSRDLLASAAEALQAARVRYRIGTADILALLTAQKDDANARQERIQALASWRIARLKLVSSLGRTGFWALQTP